jgi:hypothetical protein
MEQFSGKRGSDVAKKEEEDIAARIERIILSEFEKLEKHGRDGASAPSIPESGRARSENGETQNGAETAAHEARAPSEGRRQNE